LHERRRFLGHRGRRRGVVREFDLGGFFRWRLACIPVRDGGGRSGWLFGLIVLIDRLSRRRCQRNRSVTGGILGRNDGLLHRCRLLMSKLLAEGRVIRAAAAENCRGSAGYQEQRGNAGSAQPVAGRLAAGVRRSDDRAGRDGLLGQLGHVPHDPRGKIRRNSRSARERQRPVKFGIVRQGAA
jgi:hypothetical protein